LKSLYYEARSEKHQIMCILSSLFTDLKLTRHIQLYFYPSNSACSYQHTSGINHDVGPAYVTRRLYSVWSAFVSRVFPYW